MVAIISKPIQVNPNEVIRNRSIYPKKVDALPITANIPNPQDYALIQEGNEANVAISMFQKFGELQFFSMLQKAMETKEALATPRRFMQNLINVNSARKNETALYDALGNIIEGDRLIQYTDRLNHNCWAYLNARFPQEKIKDTGYKGLDFITINADGSEVREPLQVCLDSDCYAELHSINSQGFPTRRAFVQEYKPGETFYFYPPALRNDKPQEGYVARFVAVPDSARLSCYWHPDGADASLGGIPCAEGAVAKNHEVK